MNVLKSRTFLKVTELAVGIPFVVLLGALLHFTYEMSGHNIVVASFSAVNESFWEHLKMPFFPAVLLAVVQYARLRKDYPSFFLGKAVGIFTVPVIITVGFYSYQAIFGGHSLAYDIGLFIAAVIAGQIISYKAIVKYGTKNPASILPVVAIVAYAVVFVVFTFAPPELEPFRDPLTGGYGLGAHAHVH